MRKKLIILGAVLGVVSVVLFALATVWTEYAWFDHLKFGDAFLTVLFAKAGTGVVYGLVALVMLLLHVVLIRRLSKPRSDWTIATPEGDLDLKEVVAKLTTPVVVVLAVIVATAMGYLAARHWEDVLKFLHQTSFDQRDPVLGKDISFYLFTLPALQFSQEWLVYLTGTCAVFSTLVYMARNAIDVKGYWPVMSPGVRAHLLFSAACVVLTLGFGYYVERFETLFSKRGVAYGATYTDVNANIPGYLIMIAACIAVAGFFLVEMRNKSTSDRALKRPAIGAAVLVVLYALTTYVWPTIVQQVFVKPNELDKEREYLVSAIAGTREAYGLNKISVKEFAADTALDQEDLARNRPTIDNIKIWDHRPLRQTYQQLQVIRLYYDFPNISVDRYRIGDKQWQVMLSARELLHSQLPAQSQTWVNRHLQYTHGYGACLSPVNQSTKEGLPSLWLQDIPPQALHADLQITRPEIYYGLESDDYILVKTTTQEFDFPVRSKGKEARYTTYAGNGGVGIGSFFRRLLFTIRFSDVNLLFTSHLKEESRILFNRSIQQRVHTVAPFLMLDQEPYVTVADGRMYWIQDAYTISYRYPYSQPTSLGRRKRINYIRNSVKVVVDAYHGDMRLYVWDESDPLIQTYRKMFPTLFSDKTAMPKSLRAHVRYPKDLFTIQSVMYESFHMTDPRLYYNQEDKWNIAGELAAKTVGRNQETSGRQRGVSANQVTSQSRMSPYYMIMRLPGEAKEEFLLMVPFTPNNKQNMVAWMTARCDEEEYGKLLVYVFPKNKLVFGPMQVEARIDQDDHISQWFTLRNQQGSTVIRGDLLVIPIENALLYVEPIYLQATQTQLPELKQVIVAFDQRVEMRSTLAEALAAVFGVDSDAKDRKSGAVSAAGGALSTGTGVAKKVASGDSGTGLPTGSSSVLAAEALQSYRAGEAALERKDWAAYGEAQKALRQRLDALAKALSGTLQSGSSPKRVKQRQQNSAPQPTPQ